MNKPAEHDFVLTDSADPAAGLLYATRYGTERLEAHRVSVLSAISQLGVVFEETDDGILAKDSEKVDPVDWSRFLALVEELSILNEAIEFQETNPLLSQQGLVEFLNYWQSSLLSGWNNQGKVEAYNHATITVPMLLSLLAQAEAQGYQFRSKEKAAIAALESMAQTTERTVGRRTTILGAR